jgi:hypothetical protein
MTALEGSLSDLSMVNLIQIFTVTRKTGVLRLTDTRLEGALFVQDGRIVNALVQERLTSQTIMAGEEAFYATMRWPDARFQFSQRERDGLPYPQTITATNDHLIMEGLRRMDEADHAAEDTAGALIGVDSRVRVEMDRPLNAGADIRLTERSWRVLTLVSRGVSRVGDLAEQSSLGELRTLVTVAEMLEAGLLSLEPPAPAPPAAPIAAPPLAATAPWLDLYETAPASPAEPPAGRAGARVAADDAPPFEAPPRGAGLRSWLQRQRSSPHAAG